MRGNPTVSLTRPARLHRVALALLACGVSAPAFAANGINVTAFGLESTSMGGADIAATRDGNAVNINPAGLSRVRGDIFEQGVGSVRALDVGHDDTLGNHLDVDNDHFEVLTMAYATRLSDRLVAGVGLFAQGGLGAVYSEMNSPFGGRDRLELQMGIARLAAGVSWEIDPQWSVGLTLTANYARLEQKTLPNASVFNPMNPNASFFGSQGDDFTGLRLGFKTGLNYRASDTLNFGLIYSPKRSMPLNGSMVFNMSSIGLGNVRYRGVDIDGFNLPEEIGAGVAWQATPDLLIAFDFSWLHWSEAMEFQRVTARRPQTPGAPPVLRQEQSIDWSNQYVFALGVRYRWSERLDLSLGFNYGANPMPDRSASPLLAAIAEKHYNAGFRYRFGDEWSAGMGIEYLAPVSVDYNNAELPFGPSTVRNGYVAISVHFVRDW